MNRFHHHPELHPTIRSERSFEKLESMKKKRRPKNNSLPMHSQALVGIPFHTPPHSKYKPSFSTGDEERENVECSINKASYVYENSSRSSRNKSDCQSLFHGILPKYLPTPPTIPYPPDNFAARSSHIHLRSPPKLPRHSASFLHKRGPPPPFSSRPFAPCKSTEETRDSYETNYTPVQTKCNRTHPRRRQEVPPLLNSVLLRYHENVGHPSLNIHRLRLPSDLHPLLEQSKYVGIRDKILNILID